MKKTMSSWARRGARYIKHRINNDELTPNKWTMTPCGPRHYSRCACPLGLLPTATSYVPTSPTGAGMPDTAYYNKVVDSFIHWWDSQPRVDEALKALREA